MGFSASEFFCEVDMHAVDTFIVKRNRRKLWLDFARRMVSLLQSCHHNYVSNYQLRSLFDSFRRIGQLNAASRE